MTEQINGGCGIPRGGGGTVVGGDVGNQIVMATANNGGTAPRDPRG